LEPNERRESGDNKRGFESAEKTMTGVYQLKQNRQV